MRKCSVHVEPNDTKDIVLLTDDDWNCVDKQICRVLEFTPLSGVVKNGRVEAMDHSTPYASVVFECPTIEGKVTGYITHKVDFAMLWAAFRERAHVEGAEEELQGAAFGGEPSCWENSKLAKHGVAPNEEVWLIRRAYGYKRWAMLMLDSMLPKLTILVCPRGAYEIVNYPDFKPELSGEARYLAMKSLVQWTPEVMEK